VGKWAQRLAALMSEKAPAPPRDGTDKTDRRGVVSVLAVTTTRAAPEIRGAPRPYKLTPAEGDRAHVDPWDDAACARFVGRVALFMRCGFNATDADDLAERLHLRDVDGDDRRTCIECGHLQRGSRCGSEALGRPHIGRDDFAVLRRCPAFTCTPTTTGC
jgi:hypothetical protein